MIEWEIRVISCFYLSLYDPLFLAVGQSYVGDSPLVVDLGPGGLEEVLGERRRTRRGHKVSAINFQIT